MAKTIKTMANVDLLNEFSMIQRWAGDDFAVNPISQKEINRGYRLEKEILARMSVPVGDAR